MQDEASDASRRQQISPDLHADLQQQGGLAALLVTNLLRAMHLGGHAGKLVQWCLPASAFTGTCHHLPTYVHSACYMLMCSAYNPLLCSCQSVKGNRLFAR